MASKRDIDTFNNFMNSKTVNIFGKDYLDTDNHECQHIRNMFKDWDKHIYAQEVLNQTSANPGRKYLQEHVELYERNLRKHLGKPFASR